jgi:hypothetical protein
VPVSDGDRPLSIWRALRSPEFYLLLTACIAAVAGVSAWVVVPMLVAGLSISSLRKYMALWPRARHAGVEAAWWRTVALSLLNSLAASCAAFPLGIVARWPWL